MIEKGKKVNKENEEGNIKEKKNEIKREEGERRETG